jgi:hypothetical protein
MSMLKTLTSDDSIKAETDSVGGGNGPLDSGLYKAKVTMAYVDKSKGGALGLHLTLKTEDDREVRQTLWMSSGDAKGNKNYYEKDGAKSYLPGYLAASSLTLLGIGKEISDLDTEEKVIKLYSFDAKAELPTKVNALTDLIGAEIIVGLIRQTVDKNVKNDAGDYVPSGDTRDENEVDKFFRASDRLTTAEIRAQVTEAAFADTWEAKWAGKVRNKAKGAAAAAGTAGAPGKPAAAAGKKPAASLFS